MKVLIKAVCILVLVVLAASLGYDNSVSKFTTVKQGDLYYSGYQEFESRYRVVVIDSGLAPQFLVDNYMCKDVALVSDKKSLMVKELHGTNIVSIIQNGMNSDKYCITMIKTEIGERAKKGLPIKAYKAVSNLSNVKYVNMSYRWPMYTHEDYLEIQSNIRKGVTFKTGHRQSVGYYIYNGTIAVL